MVMVWLEGGQGEVRGACAPPPPTPQHPKSPHLDPPPHHHHPNSPHMDPPSPTDPPGAPPQAPPRPPPPHSPLLEPPLPPPPPPPPRGLRPSNSLGGSWRPEPRGPPPPSPGYQHMFRRQPLWCTIGRSLSTSKVPTSSLCRVARGLWGDPLRKCASYARKVSLDRRAHRPSSKWTHWRIEPWHLRCCWCPPIWMACQEVHS